MHTSQWLVEQERDLLCHIEDEYRSKKGIFEMDEKTIVALMTRIEKLEEECRRLREKVLEIDAQLAHQIPRIDDIEDKIDWSKKGKI